MATTSTTTGTLSSLGIGSGLDVNSIVSQLMTVEQQPLNQLNSQEATVQSQISAYGGLKGALAALQTAVHALAAPAPFRSMSANVGTASVASVTTGNGAGPGRYSLEVSKLAQSQKLVSGGFATVSDTVGSGTLTFTFGTAAAGAFTPNAAAGAKTVTIGAGQSSLAGIRDAVNTANIGVTASIVNDGSTNGQRLVFTSNATGAANSLQVTVADDDGANRDAAGLSQLAYDPAAAVGSGRNLTEKQVAQDAALTLDGIAITSASNTVTGAIAGVTLNLAGTNVDAPTSVVVTQDTSQAASAVNQFIQAYNSLQTTITNLTKYDATTKTASVLTGDSTVRVVQSQLRGLIGGSVAGAAPGLNTLSLIGITTQSDGTLTLDGTKFNAAMAANATGVEKLFSATGSSTDSLVTYNVAGSKTKAGSYDVGVTQLARQGSVAGSAPAALTITAGVNDQFAAVVDGVTVNVTLGAGTYASAGDLADEVAARVNGALAAGVSGSTVTASASGGTLTLASARYGSASSISVSGSAASGLFGTAPATTAGLDVAGTIGGVPAQGSGQTLTGAVGSPAEGLSLQITGGLTGPRGTITYSQGVGYALDQILSSVVGTGGALDSRTSGLQGTVNDMEKRKTALQTHLDQVQAAYIAQYTALDTQLAQLQSLGTYLTQQLANLPKPSGS